MSGWVVLAPLKNAALWQGAIPARNEGNLDRHSLRLFRTFFCALCNFESAIARRTSFVGSTVFHRPALHIEAAAKWVSAALKR